MFCSKCGSELLEGAKFCGGCGNPIVTNEKKTEVIAAEAVVEKEQKPEVVHEKVKEEKVEEKTPDVSQENKITINDVVELYQIVCEVCGYGLAKINGTKEIKEINKLMSPMKEYGLEEYKHNPVNMTDWNLYTQKLAEFIYKLK